MKNTSQNIRNDPRIARLDWTLDPLAPKYPELTPYQFSSNRVLDGVELEGLEIYITRKGAFIGQIGKNETIRILKDGDIKATNPARKLIEYANKYEGKLVGNTSKAVMRAASEQVTVKDASKDFQDLWDMSFKNNKEHAGYIVLDTKMNELRFEGIEDLQAGPNNVRAPYKTGDSFNGQEGIIVISNVHTHPTEHTYLGKKLKGSGEVVTDEYNFNNQYSTGKGDGKTSEIRGDTYTISKNNVDYFSSKGRKNSKNNLTSRSDLESGKFNLLKHAIKNH